MPTPRLDPESVPPDLWTNAEATVTECRYQFAGLGNLAFGFSTRKKFRIAFEYRVGATPYAGAFESNRAIPRGERLRLRYNPLRPDENTLGAHSIQPAAPTRMPLLLFGIAGSVVLSLLWLLVLRGCR